MKKQRFFLFLFFLILAFKSFSQGVLLTQPRLESNGNHLIIFYDIITKSLTDQFYIWVEIEKTNGEKILAKSFSGDVGVNIKAGNNKKIIWTSEKDSIPINEIINVVVKGEKYIKTYNKSSLILKSAVFPGWGQTIISNGKPWWLTGVAFYGTLAGGYIYHTKYLQSHDSYRAEETDPKRRDELYDQTQKHLNMSTAMIYTAVSIWTANILWIALIPNKYKPLQHANISLIPSYNPIKSSSLLSLKIEF